MRVLRGRLLEAVRSDVQRPRYRSVLRAACVALAAGLALVGRDASAQTAMVQSDPLAPQLDSNPDNPPRFEQADAPARQRSRFQPLAPPVSGAGTTGFDSTNARKKIRAISRSKPTPAARSVTPSPTTSTLSSPLTPPPLGAAAMAATPSPYDVPQIPPEDTDAEITSSAPGAPPIENVGPIRKPIPKRKALEAQDPYEPLGIRAGGFDLFPSLELTGGYDTNPGQTASEKAAWLYTIAPELRAQSHWSRHELKADLRGSYTGYSPDQTPTLSRPNINGTVDGRIDVTSRTRIDLTSRLVVSSDNPGSPNLQAGLAKLPLNATFGGSAGIGHRFNRFDLSVKGGAERTVYQNSELTDGSTASNDDRNYDQFSGTLRGGYELLPGVVPYAEVTADRREHDLETDYSGYQRDSRGLTGKIGSTFKLSHTLTGEIAIGYTERKYQDPRLQNLSGLIGDASLVWTASALTTVKLIGSSTVGESTQPGVSGVLYRNVGVQVDHAFRRWLIGTLKAGFGDNDYIGDQRNDKLYSLGAGLTYKFDREFWLTGSFQQNWLHSNQPGNNYDESIFLLTLRVQR
jgi:hypothetical protein